MQLSKISRPLAVAAVLVLTSTLAWAALGDKRTILKTDETIEVPGAVLPPGEYVVKLFDSQGLRHVVQVFNQDETELLSTIIAIPNRRLEPTEDTEFSWYETPAGQPPALRAWFYPGDTMGQEFAYPEDRATEIAEATQQEVPRLTEEDTEMADKAKEETTVALVAVVPVEENQAESTQQQAAQQDRERETAAQQERNTQAQAQREREMQAQRERDLLAQRERNAQDQRERQIAQAPETQQRETDQSLTAQQQQQNQLQNQQRNTDQDQTTQQAQQTQTTGNELPATAGFGALLALLGLGSLGASRVVRNLRSK